MNFLPIKYCKIEQKNSIFINAFCYENDLVHPPHLSYKKTKNCMDLLLLTDENIYVKDFNVIMCNKTKNKNKKHFFRYCLQCFSSEKH